MKKSFIVYIDGKDQIEELTDAEAGQLFKACLRFNSGEEVGKLERLVEVIFKGFKAQFERDEKAWQEEIRKRSEAGKKGNEVRWGKSIALRQPTSHCDGNNRNATKNIANIADSVSVSVRDSVSNKENTLACIKESVTAEAVPHSHIKHFSKPTIEEIAAYCKERNNGIDAEKFFDCYERIGWLVNKSPMKDWKAAVRYWEKNGFENKNKKGKKERDYDNEG